MNHVLKKIVRPLRPEAARVPLSFPPPALVEDYVLTPADVLRLRLALEKRERKEARRNG